MVKANELRIGNLLYFPSQSENFDNPVISIGMEAVNGFDLDQCDPIPIIEDWLIVLGFIQSESTNQALLYCGNFGIEKNGKKWNVILRYTSHNTMGDRITKFHRLDEPIHYIHQLQNLYFALTSTELEIK